MASAAAAPVTRWAREYETIYILRPDASNELAERIVERVKDVIARLDGKLTKLDNWGKRRLAYPIQKSNRGFFVYFKYVGYNDVVAELERNLRLFDEVVRFQTVLLAEDIDLASVEVDPDELQYLHVEEEDVGEDAELERARSLGMAPRPPRGGSSEDATDDDATDDDNVSERADETASEEEDTADSIDDESDEDEREEG